MTRRTNADSTALAYAWKANGQSAGYVYNGTGELGKLEDWAGATSITRDLLNRMVSSGIAKVLTNYTCDTLGNLALEKGKNKGVDYGYNELDRLVRKTATQNEAFSCSRRRPV